MKKTIFIGSSKECLVVAEEIATWLESFGITPILWDRVSELGTHFLTSLERVIGRVSGAIFVFNEDDECWYRGDKTTTVRDNVLFEYGLFSGKLSRNQVIIAYNKRPKLPSDLFGITYLAIDNNAEYSTKTKLKAWVDKLPEVDALDQQIAEEIRMQQYYIQYEELGYEYKDLNNGTFHNVVKLNCQAKSFRYYTERYSWAYGGKLEVKPHIEGDRIVDRYRDLEYINYTLRLAKTLSKNELYDTGFTINTTNTEDLSQMFVGSNLGYSHVGTLKLWAKIPSSMKFINANFKHYANPADICPIHEEPLAIDSNCYIEKKIEGCRQSGHYYSLEWVVALANEV